MSINDELFDGVLRSIDYPGIVPEVEHAQDSAEDG